MKSFGFKPFSYNVIFRCLLSIVLRCIIENSERKGFMVSEKIKMLRTQKGFSQEELAVKLGVVRQTVSKWEKGLSVPDSQMLISLAAER